MNNNLDSFLEKQLLKSKGFKLITFEENSTKSAKGAADQLGVTTAEIIKSLIVKVDEQPYLALVPGNRKIKQKLVRKLLKEKFDINIKDSSLASPDEVLMFTGYEIGSVPPLGLELPVLLDKSILEIEIVYAGGGSGNTILSMPIKEYISLIDPTIGSFTKLIT